MANIRLDYTREQARILVKEALRRTRGISVITESQYQIVGKTGISFPRILWSWGEKIYVDISDTESENRVMISVWAEKTVWMNIFANPEKFKRRFLHVLEQLRGQPIESLQNQPFYQNQHSQTNRSNDSDVNKQSENHVPQRKPNDRQHQSNTAQYGRQTPYDKERHSLMYKLYHWMMFISVTFIWLLISGSLGMYEPITGFFGFIIGMVILVTPGTIYLKIFK